MRRARHESSSSYPGRSVFLSHLGLGGAQAPPRERQKSAEAIVGRSILPKGRTQRNVRAHRTGKVREVAKEQQLSLGWDTYRASGEGEAQTAPQEGRQTTAAPTETGPGTRNLMEGAVDEANLARALRRVMANGGSPGVDGVTTKQLPEHLYRRWDQIRAALLTGTYKPRPVRACDIPKPNGGTRTLGIPTALDRLIQQMLLQVLTPILEPTFSDSSYGYRPGRKATDAVRAARRFVEDGRQWVVDLDIEAFFDRVNHDKLMAKLARLVDDKRLLKLVRAYLNAGVMDRGVVVRRHEGTPQGGPLSPLLANLYLTELDRELERRGHAFCRYADDVYIYVGSEAAASRVLDSLAGWLDRRLHLTVNSQKSKAGRFNKTDILSFTLYGGGDGPVKVRVSTKAIKRAKGKIKRLTRRNKGVAIEKMVTDLSTYLRGWIGYFAYADTPSVFRDLDSWIRRRLRCRIWKSWKRSRTRLRELRARGLTGTAPYAAYSRKGYWHIAGSVTLQHALPNSFFAEQGLVNLHQRYLELVTLRTAGCV